MTTRERCMNILHYKDADRMPAVHFGYWKEVLIEWAEQGHISAELADGARFDGSKAQRELDKIIGWDCNWYNTVGSNNKLFPRFEKKLLEVLPDGSHRMLTSNGVIEKIKAFADSINADMATTRKAVDNNILPYSLQVGLTGKTVSPPVYIAIGISGAVHHIVGMQQAGTVIAINPDKDAPIFDYADYGIITNIEEVFE